MSPLRDPAHQIVERLEELAGISEQAGELTRTFLSPAMARANELVAGWMREAGLETRIDGWGNLIGRAASAVANAKTLLVGSHLDTVRNAGRFDGPMGVLLGLAAWEQIRFRGIELPYHLEIVGFSDEEGVRFQTAYLGSLATIGKIKANMLNLEDEAGVTLESAILDFQKEKALTLPQARHQPGELLGYVEVHLEQGPQLEILGLAIGIVDHIAAQTRLKVEFIGKAGHAGTTPMQQRRDALAGAAEFVLAVEAMGRALPGGVATVGQLQTLPGSGNVIPGQVVLSVDLRHAEDAIVKQACSELLRQGEEIARRRELIFSHEIKQEKSGIACDSGLSIALEQAVQRHQEIVPHLTSGAGHDAVVMAQIAPVAMLFTRCRDGLSHHPHEYVADGDIGIALAVLTDFLETFNR